VHSDPQPRRRVNRQATRRQTQSCPGSGGFSQPTALPGSRGSRRSGIPTSFGEAPFDRDITARLVNDSLVLVEPDRNPRPDAQKESRKRPCFQAPRAAEGRSCIGR